MVYIFYLFTVLLWVAQIFYFCCCYEQCVRLKNRLSCLTWQLSITFLFFFVVEEMVGDSSVLGGDMVSSGLGIPLFCSRAQVFLGSGVLLSTVQEWEMSQLKLAFFTRV